MKLCGSCRFFPKKLSAEDLALIEKTVENHDASVIEGWLRRENLGDRRRRRAQEKARFVDLNEPVWCRLQKCQVRPCEHGCYAWKGLPS